MADCSKTEVFLAEWNRMCDHLNTECDCCDMQNLMEGACCASSVTCLFDVLRSPKEAVAIVQKWSDEHPAPKPKTYADVFLEEFPNASKCYLTEKDYVNGNGFPEVKRCNLYGVGIHGCKEGSCTRETQMKCWNEPYPEQEG